MLFAVFLDHTEPAFVTHIRNPCHFVVQLNRNIDRLTELSHIITQYCRTAASKNDVPARVEPGITHSVTVHNPISSHSTVGRRRVRTTYLHELNQV